MIQQITAKQLAARMDAGERFYLLDVRQPAEHAIAALPGSKLVPLNELTVRFPEIQVPQGHTLVVYCHHGIRSMHGGMFLAQHGLTPLSLAGGIEAWSVEVDPSVPRY
jgi:rhodanese-related sulfurtransferase